MRQALQFIALSAPGTADIEIPIAASRTAIGVLDLGHLTDLDTAQEVLRRLAASTARNIGVRIRPSQLPVLELVRGFDVILLANDDEDEDYVSSAIRNLRCQRWKVLLEASSLEIAQIGESAGADGIVATGNEAGGWVGEEGTYILLQRFLHSLKLPLWAKGGIGIHTAAACFAAGAVGVVLDSQLALAEDSSIDPEFASILARMDGTETVCIGTQFGAGCRMYCRGGLTQAVRLRQQAEAFLAGSSPDRKAWRNFIRAEANRKNDGICLIGQDAAFAAPLAARYRTVEGIIEGFRTEIEVHKRAAKKTNPIALDSPLARSHGTRYPIAQGPMTRVSDVAEFAFEVAQNGGLPFLALALMRAKEVTNLLERVHSRLAGRPWGAGILGFVPPELRSEQVEALRRYRPPFALIAGGRPDQSGDLEREGIRTYLHVPSPTLLASFLESGARRFVFEGRECGGHVGPRSSFVLWNSVIDVLLELPPQQTAECHVLFAGGVHDARSAAMVAVLAAPLAERGARIGVLLGTAYLFTEEIIACGAVVPEFQKVALGCAATTLLESSLGHAIRCAATPYTSFFEAEKKRLRSDGKNSDEIRSALEELNLGRLRIASKGVARSNGGEAVPQFMSLTAEQQRNEGMYMIGQLAALRERVCTIRELHEDVCAGASNLIGKLSAKESVASQGRSKSRGIAIVGMSCLLPGARNLRTYWQNILGKADAIKEVPKERWDWRQYFNEDPKAPDKVYSRWGGFLDEIVFDPLRYGLPPNSIPSTEPLQLLTLEAVRMALEDAGYSQKAFPRERTAVIIGVGGGSADLGLQYAFRAALPMFSEAVSPAALGKLPAWTEDSFPGILLNVVAGRVANRFDLGGVNYTVDGACASSLAAVYQAVRELEGGTSDLVITGGVDTLQSPFVYLCFSKTNAFSPRGRCRTFDESADGIVISEGLVILLLKRLSDAERDNDRIYAVIRGVGGSSDGRDKGLTAPRRDGQVRALERAYADADISPADVTLLEAHGTGTVVGDKVEIEALSEVYRQSAALPRSCALGSVKSNIGHTKSTAGAAGLAKAALALHHKQLPPTIGVTKPNKALRADSPFYLNTEARPWMASSKGHPRRAAVSAFGFGGTNFHVVLEEHREEHRHEKDGERDDPWPFELMMFSADSPEQLSARLASLEEAFGRGARPKLTDLAYTLWLDAQGTAAAKVTLAVVTASVEEFRRQIVLCRSALDDGNSSDAALELQGIYCSRGCEQAAGKLAFLFPGQGSQYPEMFRELALHLSEIRESFEAADSVLAGRLPRSLSSYVFPPSRFGAEEESIAARELTKTDVAQPALGAAEMGLFRLLKTLGVQPDMAAGHSYGEYVALCAAGVFPEEVLYAVSEARGRFILANATDEPVGMAAVEADRNTVQEVVQSLDSVWIANINAPKQSVISGTKAGLEQAARRCEAAGLRTRALAVSCAFHSPLVAAAHENLSALLSTVQFSSPAFPVFSNSTGGIYPQEPGEIAALLSKHLVSVVNFAGEVEAMYEAGARTFVEVGPRSTLTGLVQQSLEGRPHLALAIDAPGRSGLRQFLQVMAQVALRGMPFQLTHLYESRKVRKLNLASLVQETAEPAIPSTAWLVNGGSARPASDPRPTNVIQEAETSRQGSNGQARVPGPRTAHAVKEPTPVAEPVMHSPGRIPEVPDGDRDRAVLQFQQVMAKILETQREVMLAYLQHGRNGSQPNGESELGLASVTECPAKAPERPPEKVSEVPPPSLTEPSNGEREPVTHAAQDTQSISESFLRMVSDRTGYPIDVLGVDQRIEADLGIDSLKSVEILTAFQQLRSPAEQVLIRKAMDQLTRERTLRGMIQRLEQVLRGDAGVEAKSDEAKSSERKVSMNRRAFGEEREMVPRSRLSVVEGPPCRRTALSAKGAFLVTDDERGTGTLFIEQLRSRGLQTCLVRFGRGFSLEGTDSYVADLCDPGAIGGLVERIRQDHGQVGGIVHLLPNKAGSDFGGMDLSCWQARIDQDLKSLFLLLGAAAPDLRSSGSNGRSRVLSVTALGGKFGIEPTAVPLFPGHGGLAGMLKCLSLEWPGVGCKVVDVEPGLPAEKLVSLLLDELWANDDEIEVGYRGSQRFVLRSLAESRREIEATKARIEHDSVILITGGGRGITAELARALASQYQPTLVIVGRSTYSDVPENSLTAGLETASEVKAALMASTEPGQRIIPAQIEAECRRVFRERELRRNIEAMRDSGASVHYFSVDVRDAAAFSGLIESLYQTYGRIDGVVHGAGVIEDSLIEGSTPDSFDRVFETKVRSGFVLSRALVPESLKFLIFFSSVAACFGNRGQTNYAAANGVLDKLALYLDSAWPTQVLSINWGPWAEVGMASASHHSLFLERGIDLIAPVDGVKSCEWEIQHRQKGEGGVILGGGPWITEKQLAAHF